MISGLPKSELYSWSVKHKRSINKEKPIVGYKNDKRRVGDKEIYVNGYYITKWENWSTVDNNRRRLR